VGHQLLDACGARRGLCEAGWKVAPSTAPRQTLPVLPRPAPRALFWLAHFLQGVFVGALEGWVGGTTCRAELKPSRSRACRVSFSEGCPV